MLALVVALSITLDLGRLHKPANPPAVTCGIKTVSYRFVGQPGREFRYDGDAYKVPARGSIELIAAAKSSAYQIDGRSLPLDVWPIDQFGSRTVPLPARQ